MYRIVVPCQVISRIFIWPAISTGGARTGPQRGIDVDAAGCRWPARMSAYLSLFPAAVPAARSLLKNPVPGALYSWRVTAPIPVASPFALRAGPLPAAFRVRITASHRAGSVLWVAGPGLAAWSGGQRPGAVAAGPPPARQGC